MGDRVNIPSRALAGPERQDRMDMHTPGPWQIGSRQVKTDYSRKEIAVAWDGGEFGQPWHNPFLNVGIVTESDPVVYATVDGENGVIATLGGCTGAENEANARLIAAAPEMLARLREYVDAYRDHPERLGANSRAMAHFLSARALLARLDAEGTRS